MHVWLRSVHPRTPRLVPHQCPVFSAHTHAALRSLQLFFSLRREWKELLKYRNGPWKKMERGRGRGARDGA